MRTSNSCRGRRSRTQNKPSFPSRRQARQSGEVCWSTHPTSLLGTTRADIAAIPRHWLHYAQICDAPAEIPATDEELIHTARQERLLPGEGGIDLSGLFSALLTDLPISVEVPNYLRVPRLGEREWARAGTGCCACGTVRPPVDPIATRLHD